MERFWEKVKKADGCWLWIGAKNSKGYGSFRYLGKPELAHRVSFLLAGNSLKPSQDCLHSCDTPLCVRPSHLRAGSHSENMQDMVARGRHRAWCRSKTHCSNGHEFSTENTYLKKDGSRNCRACNKNRMREMRLAGYIAPSRR